MADSSPLEYPIIRIELDRMKMTLVSAMSDRLAQEKDGINEAIDRAINNFDWGKEVGIIVERVLREATIAAMKKALAPGGECHDAVSRIAIDLINEGLERGQNG